MNSYKSPSVLAGAVRRGAYVPTSLSNCESALSLDEAPHSIRFTQFLLFAEPARSHKGSPRYLIANTPPRQRGNAAKTRGQIRNEVVEPLLRRLEADLPTHQLLKTNYRSPNAVRETIRRLFQQGTELGDRNERRDLAVGRRKRLNTETLPSLDLPDAKLRKAFASWVEGERYRLLSARLGSATSFGDRGLASSKSTAWKPSRHIADSLIDAYFMPGPYQHFGAHFPIVALCVTYEQTWYPVGYTRGELVTSLSLAPGERLTLEVHNWDKSSRKSEEELSTELERRASEKMTQRDALTVAQEFSRTQNTQVNVNGTIPIPQMPISAGASISTQTNRSLKRTTESISDRTSEASNTLKVNRKSRIEVSREVGREEKQTRVLENTNRCHTLNCHYFEVMANYLVSTQPISVQACILVPNPRPTFDLDWTLCHQDVLIAALLDRTFLPGFGAAKTIKVQAVIEAQRARMRVAALQAQAEQILPYVRAILSAYDRFVIAKDTALELAESDFGALLWGLISNNSEVVHTMQSMLPWVVLSDSVHAALAALKLGTAASRNAAELLHDLLVVAPPSEFGPPAEPRALETRLQALGLDEYIIAWLMRRDPASWDDQSLRAAVEAAAAIQSPATQLQQAEVDDNTLREAAEAQVEFERLKCHMNDNWLHYSHAVWMREDHGQRFLALQAKGQLVTIIENELLGFYADRAAYPLRDLGAVTRIDLKDAIEKTKAAMPKTTSETLITLPTPGTILESVTGRCTGCEEYIEKSRVIDLRKDEAIARQEEAEAERREKKLTSTPPDLSPSAPPQPTFLALRADSDEGSITQ